MAESVVPFERALPIYTDEVRIRDVKIDASVVVQCSCAAAPVFITRLTRAEACPVCRTRYLVQQVAVVPTGEKGDAEIGVSVVRRPPASVVAPGEAH